jgi:preprotein translocase subunit SecE
VARDRKRRKSGAPKPEDSASPRARDMGLDDASIDEAGIGDTVPAPDPLKNSSAEVDQARIAETGALRGESGDVDMGREVRGGLEDPTPGPAGPGESDPDGAFDDLDFEHAPDELERDLAPSLSGRGSAGLDPSVAEEHGHHPRKQRGKVLTFLGHCVDELRRVQWPDRRQVGQATAVTLGFVVIAGTWLGLMDALWKPIVNAII